MQLPQETQGLKNREHREALLAKGAPTESRVTRQQHPICLNRSHNSSKMVEAITVTLKRIVQLKSHGSSFTTTDETQFLKIEQPSIQFGLPTKFDLTFHIPDDLQCSVTTTKLVQVFYELLIELDLPWVKNARITFPLTILKEAGMPPGMER